MVLVLLYLDRDGQLADTACLRVPRIYQVTPDIPDRRRATQQNGSQALARPTASKRVSSPPVGTIPSASDVTDSPIQTASLDAAQCRLGHRQAARAGRDTLRVRWQGSRPARVGWKRPSRISSGASAPRLPARAMGE